MSSREQALPSREYGWAPAKLCILARMIEHSLQEAVAGHLPLTQIAIYWLIMWLEQNAKNQLGRDDGIFNKM